MALQSVLVLLVLILALVAKSLAGGGMHFFGYEPVARKCNGLVGDCIDADEEMGFESESTRRSLYGQQRYISYGALSRDRVPCNRRGASYYNCNRRSRVNPYRRGCSAITRCARVTN